MENKRYKKMIYISPENNPIIERISNSENIIIINKFINQYNFSNLLKEDLKVLNNLDFLVIDLRSIVGSSKQDEIIRCFSNIRGMYKLRLIIIAQGYIKGDILLARLFAKGIYNIITANNDKTFEDEFNKTISEDGMSFSYAQKFEIEDEIYNSDKKIIKENYIRVKQDITVGVIGTQSHIGTTTHAINITKFLSELINIKACYIENNKNADIRTLENEGIIFDGNLNKVSYKNVDMFTINSIGSIKNLGYEFFIYDFGSIQDMTDNDINNFLNKDIKIIVSGGKAWEKTYLIETFEKIGSNIENDENIFFIFNFVPEEMRKEIEIDMGSLKERIVLSEYIPNPFEKIGNKYFYEKIFKKFLLNTSFEIEEKSKNPFRKLFKKGAR